MSVSCPMCGKKINFFNSTKYNGKTLCMDCVQKSIETEKEEKNNDLLLMRNKIIENVKNEIASATENNFSYNNELKEKIEGIYDLVTRGILTIDEFSFIREQFIRKCNKNNVSQSDGKYLKLWEIVKEKVRAKLVAPATAIFPDLSADFITFTDCDEDEFIFDTYVDSQNKNSALIRTKVRIAFNLKNYEYIGVSFYTDTNYPYERMEWSPYEE